MDKISHWPRILETPGLSGRAAESILHFLQVFFVCTAVLIPRQSMATLGIEILAVALLSWAIQVATQIRYAKARTGHPLVWLITRIVQTQLASTPFIVAALFLLSGWPVGVYWLVPGLVLSFIFRRRQCLGVTDRNPSVVKLHGNAITIYSLVFAIKNSANLLDNPPSVSAHLP